MPCLAAHDLSALALPRPTHVPSPRLSASHLAKAIPRQASPDVTCPVAPPLISPRQADWPSRPGTLPVSYSSHLTTSTSLTCTYPFSPALYITDKSCPVLYITDKSSRTIDMATQHTRRHEPPPVQPCHASRLA